MAMIRVRLLKPLNGREIGEEAEYLEADVARLEARGAVARLAVKAEQAVPKNKAEKAAPKNKSQG